MGFFNKDNYKDLDSDNITIKAKKLAIDYTALLEKYDEKTEEVLELYREKSEKLWESKRYYDTAFELKNELKDMKKEKADKQSEVNYLKKQWALVVENLLDNNLLKKTSELKNFEELILYLSMFQYSSKEDIPVKKIIAAIKRLKISKEDIEKENEELYVSLKIKDWEF